ncbi:STAS domain-containing protein [Falsibacillus albus]|uniref:STAS domain-containing protein n=1 Tax=Falsibacillus albus TaxID=2478915 RepID=A0A3L7JUP7_9BACI|nr:STAS domain-containing protein [Falsibacillus albus]RLQ93371.1 STAS domain-containing protein [Falsibacillus albus]
MMLDKEQRIRKQPIDFISEKGASTLKKSEYVKELEEKVKYYEAVLQEISAPIIPSIVPNTILVPLTGRLDENRLINIREKILKSVYETDIDAAIIDFTGIGSNEVEELGYGRLAQEVADLSASLKLMGVEPMYVGFSPKIIKDIVHSGIDFPFKAHSTFRTALQYLMDGKKLHFEKVTAGK